MKNKLLALRDAILRQDTQVQSDILPKYEDFVKSLYDLWRLENERSKCVKKVNEELEDLSTNLAYTMFDLEATRRERDELKKKLEQ